MGRALRATTKTGCAMDRLRRFASGGAAAVRLRLPPPPHPSATLRVPSLAGHESPASRGHENGLRPTRNIVSPCKAPFRADRAAVLSCPAAGGFSCPAGPGNPKGWRGVSPSARELARRSGKGTRANRRQGDSRLLRPQGSPRIHDMGMTRCQSVFPSILWYNIMKFNMSLLLDKIQQVYDIEIWYNPTLPLRG